MEQVVPRPRGTQGRAGRRHQKSITYVKTACKRAAKDNGGEFRLEVFRLSNEVLGTENLRGPGGFLWESHLQGRCTPKAILFVPTCFNQVLKMPRCPEMKGKPVGVVFRSSALLSD